MDDITVLDLIKGYQQGDRAVKALTALCNSPFHNGELQETKADVTAWVINFGNQRVRLGR